MSFSLFKMGKNKGIVIDKRKTQKYMMSIFQQLY